MRGLNYGAIAQLGERLHGMQEVRSSILLGSTKIVDFSPESPSSSGLGHRPFTAVTGVRTPVGTPIWLKPVHPTIRIKEVNQQIVLVPIV